MSWHLLFVFSIICANGLVFTKRKAGLNQLDSVRMCTFCISCLLSTLLTCTSKVVAVVATQTPTLQLTPTTNSRTGKRWNWEEVSLMYGCACRFGLRGQSTASCRASCIIVRGWPSGDEVSSHPLLGPCLSPSSPTNDTLTVGHEGLSSKQWGSSEKKLLL